TMQGQTFTSTRKGSSNGSYRFYSNTPSKLFPDYSNRAKFLRSVVLFGGAWGLAVVPEGNQLDIFKGVAFVSQKFTDQLHPSLNLSSDPAMKYLHKRGDALETFLRKYLWMKRI
ncbi:3648_t:CDS:2, partial [Ambispora gerdemannii]